MRYPFSPGIVGLILTCGATAASMVGAQTMPMSSPAPTTTTTTTTAPTTMSSPTPTTTTTTTTTTATSTYAGPTPLQPKVCEGPVSEADAIAKCDADVPLPNPNPLGATDEANNCQARAARCSCYPMYYNQKLFARTGCICYNSSIGTYNSCLAGCYTAGNGSANACPPPSNVNHGPCMTQCVGTCQTKRQAEFDKCTAGSTGLAFGAAVGTAWDLTVCMAKFPACVLGVLPVKP